MVRSKKGKFDKDDTKLARIARALSHPARISIIRHLAIVDSCCFNEIASVLPLASSTVSQHLTELKIAGLVKASPDLPRIKYSLDEDEWRQARKLIKTFARLRPRENDE